MTRGAEPAAALGALAAMLIAEGSVISPHVVESDAPAALGTLAASGPRAATSPAGYSLIVEAVREGYLLHYGEPRIVDRPDPDLALLAGDYLYATGLARLAELGDLSAVRELSDLISLSAHIHGEKAASSHPSRLADALWLAAAAAVGSGPTTEHERAKAAAREGSDDATGLLIAAAEGMGPRPALDEAREAIGFAGITNLE